MCIHFLFSVIKGLIKHVQRSPPPQRCLRANILKFVESDRNQWWFRTCTVNINITSGISCRPPATKFPPFNGTCVREVTEATLCAITAEGACQTEGKNVFGKSDSGDLIEGRGGGKSHNSRDEGNSNSIQAPYSPLACLVSHFK